MNDGLRLGPEPRDELLEAGHEACFPVVAEPHLPDDPSVPR